MRSTNSVVPTGNSRALAAVGAIASIAISVMRGASYLAPAVVIMLLLNIPLSYVCLRDRGKVRGVSRSERGPAMIVLWVLLRKPTASLTP